MKIKSPIVTLLVGLLLAATVTYLSVRAHQAATNPTPEPATSTYAASEMAR
jgi:hypothetical protein